MSITNSLSKIDKLLKTKFSDPSQFQVNKFKLKNKAGISVFRDDLDIVINNIQTADYQHERFDEFFAGRWSYTTGYPQSRRIVVTWRDVEDGELYTYFKDKQKELQYEYPDDQMWEIEVSINHMDTDLSYNSSPVIDINNAILIAISSFQIGHDLGDNFLTFTTDFLYGND